MTSRPLVCDLLAHCNAADAVANFIHGHTASEPFIDQRFQDRPRHGVREEIPYLRGAAFRGR